MFTEFKTIKGTRGFKYIIGRHSKDIRRTDVNNNNSNTFVHNFQLVFEEFGRV